MEKKDVDIYTVSYKNKIGKVYNKSAIWIEEAKSISKKLEEKWCTVYSIKRDV